MKWPSEPASKSDTQLSNILSLALQNLSFYLIFYFHLPPGWPLHVHNGFKQNKLVCFGVLMALFTKETTSQVATVKALLNPGTVLDDCGQIEVHNEVINWIK